MKKLSLILSTLFMSLSLPLLSYAEPTFSDYWYQDGAGTWHINDGNGNLVTDAWLCDDAVPTNGKDIWYLIDSNGNMVSAGLVQDQTGNYYSLEVNSNGYKGMLRYISNTYDGIYLDLESSHAGSFAKLKNQSGIDGLRSMYGLTSVNIDNSNCVYTSSFSQGSGGGTHSNENSNNGTTQNNQAVENKDYSDIPADIAAELKGNENLYYMGKSMGKTDDEIRASIAAQKENAKLTGGNYNGIHTY